MPTHRNHFKNHIVILKMIILQSYFHYRDDKFTSLYTHHNHFKNHIVILKMIILRSYSHSYVQRRQIHRRGEASRSHAGHEATLAHRGRQLHGLGRSFWIFILIRLYAFWITPPISFCGKALKKQCSFLTIPCR